jgi:Thermophilic metalloprotease (M29)
MFYCGRKIMSVEEARITNKNNCDWKQIAFEILLTDSLSASSEDEILIIYDDQADEYIRIIISATIKLGLSVTLINVRKDQQRFSLSQGEDFSLPEPIRLSLGVSSVVITLLDGDLSTAAFRRELLRQARTKNCRLAHIPGLTTDVFEVIARTDFHKILVDCELIAWWLGQGGRTTVTTTTANGETLSLNLTLDGWSNEPLMSPGIIQPGSWGNLPPGEVFCCPNPEHVDGAICINGSLPGLRLEDGEEVVLWFEKGRLIRWVGSSPGGAGELFFSRQAEIAKQRSDSNWLVFCELGVGLNPAISRLTGNSLFDEKAAGTLHVAIGDNTTFGHSIKAQIHADMVCQNPTLTIDDRCIIAGGELQRNQLRDDRAKWKPKPIGFSLGTPLRLRKAKIAQVNGQLIRRLTSGDRVGSVAMTDATTAISLAKLYEVIKSQNGVSLGQFIDDFPSFEGNPSVDLLSILYAYDCLIHQR